MGMAMLQKKKSKRAKKEAKGDKESAKN